MDGYGPSTYGDRIAEVYDDWYGTRLDPTEAVDFLASFARGGRVLELGIGTGRVALPLSERGVDVSGIDASTRMVDRLRAKPGGADIPVTIGDFADVPADGTFSLVFIAFTTFFALPSQDAQLHCLRRVAEVLEPDGHFVLDVFVPDVTRFSFGQSTTTLETDTDHVLFDAMRHDPLAQVIEGNHVLVTEHSTSLFPLRIRYCWPSELDLIARLSGLELEERFASYDRSPFDARSTRHVSVYRRIDSR
jgi:SAM-dependent methyltransferase